MKRIDFTTTNKVIALSIAAAVKGNRYLRLGLSLLLNPSPILDADLDEDLVRVDIAGVDVMSVTTK